MMKKISFALTIILCALLVNCLGQKKEIGEKNSGKIVGGTCDGCELMHIGMPKNIKAMATSTGWNEPGQKLVITGTVFHLDGKTPASNIIVYYWQTDNSGRYLPGETTAENAKKHGRIRGWIKTGIDGKYTIKTIRPAPYPDGQEPAHIHLVVKEPNIDNGYYIDDINFDDDKLLIPHIKKYPLRNRGGSGIVRVLLKDSLQLAEHNIILGLNIPNYPKQIHKAKQSGLNIGEDQPSFTPFHAWGPDKGKQTCPVCKYGRYYGIIYFAGNNSNWREVKTWLRFLEQEAVKRKKYLKVYFVYGNDRNYNKQQRESLLESLGKELNIQNTALTFVPSFSDKGTEANLNQINPSAANTFIIYKHRNIIDKYVDIKPTEKNFKAISETLRKHAEYFDLAAPEHN